MSLERCLQEISDEDGPLNFASLIELASCTEVELAPFTEIWQSVSTERRNKIIAQLVEMAEENPNLDFGEVFKLSLNDPNEAVREKAISGLWEVEDRQVIHLLLELLRFDKSSRVRAAAATGLGKFAHLAQDGKILDQDAEALRESLMEVLKDEVNTTEVRRRALEAVSPFNLPAIQEYIRWAYQGSDLKLKCSALYAMGRTQEKAWLPAIIAEMKSPNAPLRYEAAAACGELGEEEMSHHLIPLLEDDDREVQMASVLALGKIGGGIATRALRRCLRNGDEALREAAQEALEDLEI